MAPTDVVQALLAAYRSGDLAAAEALLGDDLVFTSPQDDGIDKPRFLERCFPTAGRFVRQDVLRLVDLGDGVVLLQYEYELADGAVHRNVEVTTVRDGLVRDVQVHFGGRVDRTAAR